MRDDLFCDPETGGPLTWGARAVTSANGKTLARVVAGISRLVHDSAPHGFGLRWSPFTDVQLDGENSTTKSRQRFLSQSGSKPENFANKEITSLGDVERYIQRGQVCTAVVASAP